MILPLLPFHTYFDRGLSSSPMFCSSIIVYHLHRVDMTMQRDPKLK